MSLSRLEVLGKGLPWARAEAGADLEAAVDQEGRAPAHYAAAYGQVAVLQFLREVPRSSQISVRSHGHIVAVAPKP